MGIDQIVMGTGITILGVINLVILSRLKRLSERLTEHEHFITYLNYCIKVLVCNDYHLLGTNNGREMSLDESYQLLMLQQDTTKDAAALGLPDPFPRIKDPID